MKDNFSSSFEQFGLTLVLNVEQAEYMTGGQTQTVSNQQIYMLFNQIQISVE